MSSKEKNHEKARAHRLRAERTKRARIAEAAEVYGEFSDLSYGEIKRMAHKSKAQRDRAGQQKQTDAGLP